MARERDFYDKELENDSLAEGLSIEEDSSYTENRRQRIKREVVIINPDNEEDEELDKVGRNEEDEEERDEEEDGEDDGNDDKRRDEKEVVKEHKEKSLLQHIITGSLLTDGTMPYYRYFIAIAVMCFLSIFLTFMSLNTNHELRRKEKQATLLHERSVIKDEVRYEVSSKSEVTKRLKGYDIELIDLSKSSRLIEK